MDDYGQAFVLSVLYFLEIYEKKIAKSDEGKEMSTQEIKHWITEKSANFYANGNDELQSTSILAILHFISASVFLYVIFFFNYVVYLVAFGDMTLK